MSTRADLSWALKAALPHVGGNAATAGVGLYQDVAWATDRYTIGIARIGNGQIPWCEMSTSEAKELERFVRPSRVAHKTEEVILKRADQELHVGLVDSEDTAVFELLPSGTLTPLAVCVQVLEINAGLEPVSYEHCPYDPEFLARFAAAKQDPFDRLWLSQRRANNARVGDFPAALVIVGDKFIGSIAGLSVEPGYEWPTVPDSSFYVQLRAGNDHSGS